MSATYLLVDVTAVCTACATVPTAAWPGSGSPRVRVRRLLRAAGIGTPRPTRAVVRRVRVTVRRLVASRSPRDGEDLVELMTGLAAHLRIGADPVRALARSVDDLPPTTTRAELGRLVQQLRMGAWAPATLRAHGHDELRWLAAAWQVSERSGAALAPVVDGLASALRAQAMHARAVHAELAGVRTSARLLALVPLVGLVMAVALGAHPVAFLLGTDAGRLCLAGGLMLEWAGLRWSGAIADRARRAC